MGMAIGAGAQQRTADLRLFGLVSAPGVAALDLPAPQVRLLMPPQLALQTYEANAERQLSDLGYSSDVTVIEAALPGTGQKGRFELRRSFMAPKSLVYGAIKFAGDNFIKTNIILKLLTSEVDHVEKGQSAATAITARNYKFDYKSTASEAGRTVYEFRVKPRKKRAGLFKGKIFLDAQTGRIVRAEGRLVKSPSLFVKRIDFAQDYADVAGFSLPVRIHSVAKTRFFGQAVVDISHFDYSAAPLLSSGGESAGGSLQ